MDNRLRFLYPVITELWGHGNRVSAGRGDPVQARRGAGGKTPVINWSVMGSERKGSEAVKDTVEKSRYS